MGRRFEVCGLGLARRTDVERSGPSAFTSFSAAATTVPVERTGPPAFTIFTILFTKYLTIYRMIIVSLSYDPLTTVTYNVLRVLLGIL